MSRIIIIIYGIMSPGYRYKSFSCNVNNLNYTKTLKLKVDFKVENKIYIQITRKLAHSKEEKNKFLTKKSQSILSLLAKGRNCFIDFMVDSC